MMVADQLRDYLENGNIANAVNFPAVSMARESAYRVAIANANVPNMVGQISTAMANAGLNIHNMVNKSRGDMAYTLVDVDSPVSEAVLADIGAHRGRAVGALSAERGGLGPVPTKTGDALASCRAGRGHCDGNTARASVRTRSDCVMMPVSRRSPSMIGMW